MNDETDSGTENEEHELREKIADELSYNDECGSRHLATRAEYLADADAILRIVAEHLPSPERDARDGTAAVEDVRTRVVAEVAATVRRMDDPKPIGARIHHEAHEVADFIEREFASPASTGDRASDEDPTA